MRKNMFPHFPGDRWVTLLIVVITLISFGLRVWRLDTVPPGWRDDELINSLVISQKAVDGDLSLYYPDASGHEALYHLLNAIMLALFGPGAAGIRLLSVFLGTVTVPLTYQVAGQLYGRKLGLLAAAALGLSFWSIMYSRIGIRHISLLVFMLPAFYFFLKGLELDRRSIGPAAGEILSSSQNRKREFVVAGIFMGLGFYTYFASRGIPIILLVFSLYLLLFFRSHVRPRLAGIVTTLAIALIIATPLLAILAQQPESEARVGELAVPLIEAREGDYSLLFEHVKTTLMMFHATGDGEWLYNIPGRAVFGPIGAVFFWAGVLLAAWYAVRPIIRFFRQIWSKSRQPSYLEPELRLETAGAFLLIWWMIGISPAFVSIPAASLGHAIIAQPAVYILTSLPILATVGFLKARTKLLPSRIRWVAAALSLLLLISIMSRDLPDYFLEWPTRGMTRFLYRADIKNLSSYVNDHPELTEFSVSSLLAGPWDKVAFEIDLEDPTRVKARWYNPERAAFLRIAGETPVGFHGYPLVPALDAATYEAIPGKTAGGYQLSRLSNQQDLDDMDNGACFRNGLCVLAAEYDPVKRSLLLVWETSKHVTLPDQELISNPPPPGVYAGPRLLVFSQLLGENGEILAGDDGLWVDASTLEPGDRFLQEHRFTASDQSEPNLIIFGLYDPLTNQRILTEDSRDHIELELTR